MIIKSMSRKEPSFRQLMDYIDRELDGETFRVRHNLMARGRDRARAEFEHNAQLMKKRKNGVYLYHEIISITRAKGLPAKEQQELLYGIVQQYVAARCPDNLVYGGMHQDKDHSYHFHLMISANRAGEMKRLRLTKAQFREIQVELEAHVLQKHPELEQQLAIGKRSERKKARGAIEHERRTGRPPSRKEALQGRLRAAMEGALGREAFEVALSEQGFRHEPRGKTFGRVIDEFTGKAHRIATLDAGLAEGFIALLQEPELEAEAEADPEQSAERSGGPADEKEKVPRQTRAEARRDADIDAAEREIEQARRSTRKKPDPERENNERQERKAEKPEQDAKAQRKPEQDPERSSQQERWSEEIRQRRSEERGRDDDHER